MDGSLHPGSFRNPQDMLASLTPRVLKEEAQRTRTELIRECVKRPFRVATHHYSHDVKGPSREVDTHSVLARRVDLSRSTVTRLHNGSHVLGTGLATLDTYLERVGSSLSEVMPTRDEITHNIMRALISKVAKARRIAGEGIDEIHVDDECIVRINRLVRQIGVLDHATLSDTSIWVHWLEERHKQRDLVGDEGSNKGTDIDFVIAGDWLAANRYLPSFVGELLRLGQLLEEKAHRNDDLDLLGKAQSLAEGVEQVGVLLDAFRFACRADVNGSTVDANASIKSVARRLKLSKKETVFLRLEMVSLDASDFCGPDAELGVLLTKSPPLFSLIVDLMKMRQ